jgi:hypothetical protein
MAHSNSVIAPRMLFAAACLRGEPDRSIEEDDVRYWVDTDVLLPIADALKACTSVRWPVPERVITDARRIAAAMEAGERRVVRDVVRQLKSEGIQALLLKGAALSHTVYPAPWLRAHSDVDLLVAPSTMQRATDILTQMGFVKAQEVSHPLITRQRHFISSGEFRVALDVHESLVNPPVFRRMPGFDVLRPRAQAVPELEGLALSTSDALLHALVHRVAHHNCSNDLLWLYDIHLLCARMTDCEWDRLVAAATEARVCQVAFDGLQQVVRAMRSNVPQVVLEHLQNVRGEPTAELLGGRLTELKLQWVNWKSLDGVRTRLAFVRAHLAPPAAELPVTGDSWRLPVHYAHRAIRGARKWLRPIAHGRS